MRLVLLLFTVMAGIASVEEEELQRVCAMQENTLGRLLKDWERKVVAADLRNEKLKALSREERAQIVDFDKVIFSMFARQAQHPHEQGDEVGQQQDQRNEETTGLRQQHPASKEDSPDSSSAHAKGRG